MPRGSQRPVWLAPLNNSLRCQEWELVVRNKQALCLILEEEGYLERTLSVGAELRGELVAVPPHKAIPMLPNIKAAPNTEP